MKRKLLILGALPSELGGSYTTGVTNVVSSLSPFFSKDYQTALFATNVRIKGIKLWIPWPNNDSIRIYGYTYLKLLWLFLKEIFFHPFKSYREMIEYRQVYGAPPLRMFLYRVNLSNVLYDFKPDILHIHGLLLESVVKNTGYSGLKITTLHGIPIKNKEAIEVNKNRGFDLKKGYYNSSKIITALTCLNHEKLKEAKRDLKIKDIPTKVINNGVDLKIFYFDKVSRDELRWCHNILSNEIVFLTVATLSKWKNQIEFIRFFYKFNLPGKYWIIGEGTEYNILRQEIHNLKLENRIKLFGFISHKQLYKYYSASDIYVLPSSTEGQSLTISEAAATGLKILVNNKIKGTLELPKEISKYIYCLDINTSNISDEFIYWVNKNVFRKEIITAMQCFSWDNIANIYIKFFKELGA